MPASNEDGDGTGAAGGLSTKYQLVSLVPISAWPELLDIARMPAAGFWNSLGSLTGAFGSFITMKSMVSVPGGNVMETVSNVLKPAVYPTCWPLIHTQPKLSAAKVSVAGIPRFVGLSYCASITE